MFFSYGFLEPNNSLYNDAKILINITEEDPLFAKKLELINETE